MNVQKQSVTKAVRQRVPRTLAVLSAVVLMTGCSVAPRAITPQEVRDRVENDKAGMYEGQTPIEAPITMEEAVARALKFNLDYRLKKIESALAMGLTDYAKFDMLPQIVASAGYQHRNNLSGGVSVGILDGQVSERPTSSDERNFHTNGIEFSWNVLDFGVSYYRARQQGDQFLIAEERRRKVVQNILQDVRAAYWRALGAQRLNAQADDILQRAAVALNRSREAETQKIIPPGVALAYQRALLDATTLLNQRRQDLVFAKRELAALMNVPPDVDFQIAEASEMALPAAPRGKDIGKLEDMALLQRPELREEDFRKRISADEARKQVLSVLPNFTLGFGPQRTSNDYTYYKSWSQGSANVAWNLMRLASGPALKDVEQFQEKTDATRRMALSMAILTQVRVGAERYAMALEDLRLADQAAQVDTRLAAYTKASVSSKLDSELEFVRTQARAVLGAYQRANAYANAHIAFGRLYNSLGFDPLADNFEERDLTAFTQQVKTHLRATEKDAFVMSSNLFGRPTAVKLDLVGITDPLQANRMRASVAELLERNQIATDDKGGIPLRLEFTSAGANGVDKATWKIQLIDAGGQMQKAQFDTSIPAQARASIYESSLIAAMNAHLGQVKTWLNVD